MSKRQFFVIGYISYRVLEFLSKKSSWIQVSELFEFWKTLNHNKRKPSKVDFERFLKNQINQRLITIKENYEIIADYEDGYHRNYFRIEKLRKLIKENGNIKIEYRIIEILPLLEHFYIRTKRLK